MTFLYTLLFFFLGLTAESEALRWQNPFKPGKVDIKFSSGIKTITRSTSCNPRHQVKKNNGTKKTIKEQLHFTSEDKCTCCLLKRAIRRNSIMIKGAPYIRHCKRKGYCNDYVLTYLAGKVGMGYANDGTFHASLFIKRLAEQKIVS